jgi:hypothetical protein
MGTDEMQDGEPFFLSAPIRVIRGSFSLLWLRIRVNLIFICGDISPR